MTTHLLAGFKTVQLKLIEIILQSSFKLQITINKSLGACIEISFIPQ